MGAEPIIPLTEGDLPKDPVETGEGTNENKSGEQNGQTGEKPTVSEEQYQKLVEGWREDREEAEKEIADLKKQARSSKPNRDEEDELDGLDEDERVEKLIEIRQRREKDLEKAELRKAQGEIRFYERTSKEFADNKTAILKVARDYECKNLKQASMIWRGLERDKSSKDEAYNDTRKRGADGKSGGNGASGRSEVTPYNHKTESNKSFGQMFREGGVN